GTGDPGWRAAAASAVNPSLLGCAGRRTTLRRSLQRYRREIMLTPRRLELGPPHDLEPTIEVLDHGGAGFDPIAAIDLAQPQIITDHRVMPVPPNKPRPTP